MKKLKSLVAIVLGFFLVYATTVFAAGSVTVGMGGNSSVAVGSTIDVTIYLDNVNASTEGIIAFQGDIHFDTNYLELVTVTPASSPYSFDYEVGGTDVVYLTGLDTSFRKGIKSNTTIYTFTFKALKNGTTTVTLENVIAGDPSGDVSANNSSKVINIGGSSSTPTVKSSDADLKSLSVSGYNISPAFDAATTTYTLTVPSDASNVTIAALPSSGKASVSGVGSKTLSDGLNSVEITVTAEDGTKKTYTVNITKEASTVPTTKSSDATLKSLELAGGYTVSPTFTSDKTTYSLTVPNNVTSLDVTAIANDANAKVEVTGNTNWKTGVNPVKVTVTAEDGTTKVYTVNVTRKDNTSAVSGGTTPTKSSNNYLKELSTKNGDISPVFSKTTSNYSVTVPYNVSRLDLNYLVEDEKSSVKINGNSDFKVESVNTVEVVVTAEDGSQRTYTINVTRSSKTGENLLDDIIIGGGSTSLNPKFKPTTYDYGIELDRNTTSIDITPITSNPNAKVEVTGNENLQEGNNTILIKVTDQEGFVQYYKINAYKKATNGIVLFGIDFPRWMVYTAIALVPALLILLVLAKKKQENKELAPAASTIEFKPEFNFSSKNGTDDDYVESGGVLNQVVKEKEESLEKTAVDIRDIPTSAVGITEGISTGLNKSMMEEYPRKVIEEEPEQIPYDPYDDKVTKEELIDAINEKNPEKLKILYQQEMLNREKERVKEAEYHERHRR